MSTQPNSVDSTCTSLPGTLTCLTRGAIAGLTFKVTASLLSFGFVLYTFFFIVNVNRHSSNGFRIFYNSMDILIFALLFADLVQAVGGLLSLKWILDGVVQAGTFCTAQGILKTLGETSVALTTLLIAIYTFVGVSTGRGFDSMRITVALVVGIWIFVGVLIGVGHAANQDPSKPFMLPVPYWCWVGSTNTWKIVAEYLWLWIALTASCLLYILLYLWMRGNLAFHESKWYAWSFQWTVSDPDVRSIRRKALTMLMYPMVSCVCIVPLTGVRWSLFLEKAVPLSCTFAVITLFGLSGFFDVILVFTTKPNLGLFGHHEVASSGRPPSPSSISQFRLETEPGVGALAMKKLPSQTN